MLRTRFRKCFAATIALIGLLAPSAPTARAAEFRDFSLVTSIPFTEKVLKTKIGVEIHMNHSEVDQICDGGGLGTIVANPDPRVAAAVPPQLARHQEHGQGPRCRGEGPVHWASAPVEGRP